MNWFTAQCRKAMYNMAFGTQFRYFGKACTVDISGQVKIGKNVYIGDHVSLIVEQGAILEIADNSFIGESCYIKCFGGKVSIGKDVSINSKSFINGCGGVTIGDNTRIGTQSIMIASNHKFGEAWSVGERCDYQAGGEFGGKYLAWCTGDGTWWCQYSEWQCDWRV